MKKKKSPEWFNTTSASFIELAIAILAGLVLFYFSDNPTLNIIITIAVCIVAISSVVLTNIWGREKEVKTVTIVTVLVLLTVLSIGGAVLNVENQPTAIELTDTQVARVLNNATQLYSDVQTAQALATKQEGDKTTATYQAVYKTVAAQDKQTAEVASAQTQLAAEKTQTQNAVLGTTVANNTSVAQATETAAYLATKLAGDREKSIQSTAQAVVNTQEAQASATQAVQQATSDWIFNHSFTDDFSDDKNDWSGSGSTYDVSIADSTLNVHVDSKFPKDYFIWSCSKCSIPTDYKNYSFEVIIRPPQNAKSFVGLVFGSDKKIDNNVDVYVARLSTTGSFYMYRASNEGFTENVIDIPFQNSLVGTYRNSLIIKIDVKNSVADIYVNDVRLQQSPVSLQSSIGGFFGIIIQSPPTGDTRFDSIRIRPITP